MCWPPSFVLSRPNYSLCPHFHTQIHTNSRVQVGFLNLISFPISCCHLLTLVTLGMCGTTANSLLWFVSLGTDGLPICLMRKSQILHSESLNVFPSQKIRKDGIQHLHGFEETEAKVCCADVWAGNPGRAHVSLNNVHILSWVCKCKRSCDNYLIKD